MLADIILAVNKHINTLDQTLLWVSSPERREILSALDQDKPRLVYMVDTIVYVNIYYEVDNLKELDQMLRRVHDHKPMACRIVDDPEERLRNYAVTWHGPRNPDNTHPALTIQIISTLKK